MCTYHFLNNYSVVRIRRSNDYSKNQIFDKKSIFLHRLIWFSARISYFLKDAKIISVMCRKEFTCFFVQLIHWSQHEMYYSCIHCQHLLLILLDLVCNNIISKIENSELKNLFRYLPLLIDFGESECWIFFWVKRSKDFKNIGQTIVM